MTWGYIGETLPPSSGMSVCDERDRAILDALVQASGFVSGERLAGDLGISRPALSGRVRRLQLQGLQIDAVRGQGYRLDSPYASEFHGELLGALLRNAGAGVRWFWLEATDSTNSECERRLAAGEVPPIAVAARQQSSGRGRLGRVWESSQVRNLYLSLAWKPALEPSRMQTFTLWMGLALCLFLRARYRLPIMIKWPNDLHLHGRKLAGMLTEARIDVDRTRDLIFGVGLNLGGDEMAFPPELRPAATTLQAHLGVPLDLNEAAASVITNLLSAAETYFAGDVSDDLNGQWPEVDALVGKTVDAQHGNRRFDGTVRGIDREGRLRLQLSDGTETLLNAGEVTLARRASDRGHMPA